MKKKIIFISSNFFAVVLLFALISAPIYFAQNFSKVAGVKSQSPFVLVSQISKFPNLKLTQKGDEVEIQMQKQSEKQAFLSPLVINNPTNGTKTYSLKVTSGTASVFFGQDYKNLLTKISLQPQTSIPISVFSIGPGNVDVIVFKIITN